MRKCLFVITCLCGIAFTSCKKDHDCECVTTVTDRNGDSQKSQPVTTTYIKVKKSYAKSQCQKETITDVNESGATQVTVKDCKLI
jgi:hypothetical protein